MNRPALVAAAACALFAASGAQAAPTFYVGGDDHATGLSQMPNAQAAAAAFDAAVPIATRVDFETAPVGMSYSNGSIIAGVPVQGCANRCGYNTTAGGQFYLTHNGNLQTFTFANAITSFGVYITGLQATLVGGPSWMWLGNDTANTVYLPGIEGGGGAFFGFTNAAPVNSVSFYTRSDIVGFDDIRYAFVAANTAVPEPATWAMMMLGFGAMGHSLRRRRRTPLRRSVAAA